MDEDFNKMKRIFLVLLSIIVNAINAQTQIFPLDTKGERIEGAYYKDLDNDLTPYVGTWVGDVKEGTFKITFEKVKEHQENRKIWKDRLYGKYEMRDKQGNLPYSNYNSQRVKVKSYTFVRNKRELNLGFIDSCIVGYIYLKFTDASKTKIEWEYDDIPQTITESRAANCAKINEMPQEKFILTKQ